VGLALGVAGEGVDDPERDVVGAQGEPHRRAGFGVGEVEGAGEERGDLVGRLGLGDELGDDGLGGAAHRASLAPPERPGPSDLHARRPGRALDSRSTHVTGR
jgi:hypothetical protein